MSHRSALTGVLLLLSLVGNRFVSGQTPPAEVAVQTDRLLAEELWGDQTAEPAPTADDFTFLRRATLDLIGHLPTPDEITMFVLDPFQGKRAEAIERLLDDPRFGVNWARYWRDVVMSRRSEERALLASDAMERFLTEEFNRNRSWDEVVRSFITAEGDVRERGETAVIMAQLGRPEETVAELTRIFLGIQIQCAQCHDHPWDRWEREQFHELAAFFPRVAVRPRRDLDRRTFEVVANDNPRPRPQLNDNNRFRGTLEHRMPDLEDPVAEGQLMQPTFFVSGQQLPLGTSDDERRSTLAEWFTSPDNRWFARATVNRLWAELVGAGFYHAVDDIGPDRECRAPRTLDYLANEFVQSGYDLKWLFRTIMLTTTYARESRSRGEAETVLFLHTYRQRLRADQLFNALSAALWIEPGQLGLERPRGRATDRPLRNPRRLFSAVFEYDPSDPRDEVTGSVPQALLLMNSALVERLLRANRPNGLGGLLERIPDDRQRITELYLRSLSRLPHDRELAVSLRHVRKAENRGGAFEDLLWALVNSSEFMHRH